MTFAEKLQMLRKERGLSQDQLASALEVSRQSVSNWELGNDMPKVDKILLLSDFFDVSADYLLRDGWTENLHRAAPVQSFAHTPADASLAPPAPPRPKRRPDIGFLLWSAAFFGILIYLVYTVAADRDPAGAFIRLILMALPLIPLYIASYLVHLLIRSLKKYLSEHTK